MRPDAVETVAVIAGGQAISPAVAARVGDVDYVIAADSGLQAAERLGLVVDVVVGDLDSVDPALLERRDLEVDRHPRAKDQTDIVLALDRARDTGATEAIVVSGGGGRLDHALANLLVLASPRYAQMRIRALVGEAEVAVVRHRHTMTAPAGTVVSLFAVDGPALGVTTEGLRYPLRDEVLDPLSSRGVSNEFSGGPASITIAHGALLVIRPGGERRDSQREERHHAAQPRPTSRPRHTTLPTRGGDRS
jgi:thiamine pyrophosphokinase